MGRALEALSFCGLIFFLSACSSQVNKEMMSYKGAALSRPSLLGSLSEERVPAGVDSDFLSDMPRQLKFP